MDQLLICPVCKNLEAMDALFGNDIKLAKDLICTLAWIAHFFSWTWYEVIGWNIAVCR